MSTWQNGAIVKPPHREPVVTVATDPKGKRFYEVMCYDQERDQWTSPGGIVVWWSNKWQGRPAPWWMPVAPMPPEPLPEGTIEMFTEVQP